MDVTVTEARTRLSELVNLVAYQGRTIVLTRHGQAVAEIRPVEGAEGHGVVTDLSSRSTGAGPVAPLAARDGGGPTV